MDNILDIYSFTNYKLFLKKRFHRGGQFTKGERARLAAALGCQASYLSQVIGGKPHLTLEQTIQLGKFLNFSTQEQDFLLLLVEYARAGSTDLKNYFKSKMDLIREDRLNLAQRLSEFKNVDPNYQQKYYSAWYYMAIHMFVTLPDYKDSQSLAQRLHLPISVVTSALQFLQEAGIIAVEKGRYVNSELRLHLARDSEFVRQMHMNWRAQALLSVSNNLDSDLHYTTVATLSRSDFIQIKEILSRSIQNISEVIRPSPEEEVYAILIDAFNI